MVDFVASVYTAVDRVEFNFVASVYRALVDMVPPAHISAPECNYFYRAPLSVRPSVTRRYSVETVIRILKLFHHLVAIPAF